MSKEGGSLDGRQRMAWTVHVSEDGMDVSMNARTICPARKRKSKIRCQEGKRFLNKEGDDDLMQKKTSIASASF